MIALTHGEQAVVDFIRTTVAERGFPPSIREIGNAVGVSSVSTVSHRLRRLEEKGWIVRDHSRARSIRILEPAGPIMVNGSVPLADYIKAANKQLFIWEGDAMAHMVIELALEVERLNTPAASREAPTAPAYATD